MRPRHGTLTRYTNYKCRCRPCRNANRDYQRDLRELLKKLGEDVPHGTVNGYVNYGCRCELCSKAKTKSKRVARLRKKRQAA